MGPRFDEPGRGPEPLFYPFLTPDGRAVVVPTLSLEGRRMRFAAATRRGHFAPTPLLEAYPGSSKLERGVFVHHGPDGILLIPVGD